MRKVNIAQALVEYDEAVPARQRHKNPIESVGLAAEVRITAEQERTADGSGNWQAKRVLILARASAKEKSYPPRGLAATLKKRAWIQPSGHLFIFKNKEHTGQLYSGEIYVLG